MKSGHAEIDGARMHWRESGAGEAVVLLHAFPLHSAMWMAQLEALPAERHWIAPDARGFGGSQAGSVQLTMDRMADDVAALLDHLGHERATLCGVSMGGYVCFAFWRRHRERAQALVLCDTRASADDPAGRLARRLSSERVRAEGAASAVSQLLDRLVGETTRRSRPAVYEEVRSLLAGVAPAAFARAQAAMAARPDSTPLLPEIEVPALVVAGDEDAMISVDVARSLARTLPNAALAVIDGAGHLPPLERPDAFNRALLDFLRGP
ncbi:MAG TPA: alpha/beta fold hydrolase [Longimicrobiales bacterium]|nr:alpha/beta fold hydrolase [Longimicrobiales bacterium]